MLTSVCILLTSVQLPWGLHKVPLLVKLSRAYEDLKFNNPVLDGDTYFIHVAVSCMHCK